MSDGPIEFDIDELEQIDVTKQEKPEASSKVSGSSSRSSSSKRKTTRSRKPSKASLQGRLQNLIELIGTVLSGFDSYDGKVIRDAAPDLAEQLDLLSRENETVRKFLEGALATGAWGGVLGVLGMQIAAPIAVHHRALPEPINSQLAAAMEIPVREPKRKDDEDEGDLDRGAGSVG